MKAVIIQARMGSLRLPGKVLMNIGEKPILQWVIERVKAAKLIDAVIVATSDNKEDDLIEKLAEKLNVECFRGSEEDVLKRFYLAARNKNADTIIRISADCPFIDPLIIDELIINHFECQNDYTANDTDNSYPKGTDVEIFSFASLEKAHLNAQKKYQREHVTPYIYEHPEIFKIKMLKTEGALNVPNYRFCVDEEADLFLARKIFNYLKPNEQFTAEEIIGCFANNPELSGINKNVKQIKVL